MDAAGGPAMEDAVKLEKQIGRANLSSGASCAVLANPQQADRQKQENAWIAARLRERDPEIIDYLIVQFQHRLMRHLIYLTGDRELAEDLFQETWMRVLLRGSQFKGDAQFVTWLFSIARNLVFDLRRRSPATTSFEAVTEAGDERCLDRMKDEESALGHCIAEEDSRLLADALGSLTVTQREVVMLRFREELPLVEIAKRTRAPLSTVKARLYRGLAVLREHVSAMTRSRPAAGA